VHQGHERAILAVGVAPANHMCVINTHEAAMRETDHCAAFITRMLYRWVVFVENRN
jgi:uncharacterized protein YdiU (UPF0061 family)